MVFATIKNYYFYLSKNSIYAKLYLFLWPFFNILKRILLFSDTISSEASSIFIIYDWILKIYWKSSRIKIKEFYPK